MSVNVTYFATKIRFYYYKAAVIWMMIAAKQASRIDHTYVLSISVMTMNGL